MTEKQVDLTIESEEIKMDCRILESLKDSLMHQINSSIDNGRGSPNIREGQHKPAPGTIRIQSVPFSGSKVGIEVYDDGAGIRQ
ncbi:MAG: hypothetical protein WCF90_08865 [Methanomicrobiales archaeon]